jgi:phosphoenolpyruvate carboxylase
MSRQLQKALLNFGFDASPQEEHLSIVRAIRKALASGDQLAAGDLLLRAALLRRFLG